MTSDRLAAVPRRASLIAAAALCAHMPMLFGFEPADRYAILVWDLTLMRFVSRLARRIAPAAPLEIARHVAA